MDKTIEELIVEDKNFLDETWNGFTHKMKYQALKAVMGDVLEEEFKEVRFDGRDNKNEDSNMEAEG